MMLQNEYKEISTIGPVPSGIHIIPVHKIQFNYSINNSRWSGHDNCSGLYSEIRENSKIQESDLVYSFGILAECKYFTLGDF